ncbi:hypothetical protein [Actinomycetospora atypica]|uniref:Uncharacterized protein n=1 Tax=Actinomycetospora atypica TaxID=1290095 RepID=A0ABV9YNF8_9PSEU
MVYDNSGTTHVVISDELHGRTAALPHVASIKIPALPADLPEEMVVLAPSFAPAGQEDYSTTDIRRRRR